MNVEQEVVAKRVVWMRPTAVSPMCKYEITPRTQKATSQCGVWVSLVSKMRVFPIPGHDVCPLCAEGRRVQEVKS